jgi:hypothetical protein
MEQLPNLTQTDYRFLSRTKQSGPDEDEEEGLDWPAEITEDQRKEILSRLRKALARWKAEAGGETLGEDYIVLKKEKVAGGTLTGAISIHNLAMMFAKQILSLPKKSGSLVINRSRHPITLEDLAKYSEEQGYNLEEYIRKPKSFFSFLVEP